MDLRRILGLLALLSVTALGAGCQNSGAKPPFAEAAVRELASSLYNNQLYGQAVAQYTYLLQNYKLDDKQAANINYTIADIYFERVHDYENALAYYLKIKHLYPESPLIAEINKKMVTCLERLERSTDAQQVLQESALLDQSQAQPKRPGAVIARIGKRSITTGDLDYEISQLPPYMKTELTDKSQKIDFLKQYIATELFYSTAKRDGLDRDPEVVEGAFRAKKNLMVQKLLQSEISKDVNVQESDVELYYKAHRQDYADKDDNGKILGFKQLADIRPQVMQDLIKFKQKEAYKVKLQSMMRAEAVEIYEDKL